MNEERENIQVGSKLNYGEVPRKICKSQRHFKIQPVEIRILQTKFKYGNSQSSSE